MTPAPSHRFSAASQRPEVGFVLRGQLDRGILGRGTVVRREEPSALRLSWDSGCASLPS